MALNSKDIFDQIDDKDSGDVFESLQYESASPLKKGAKIASKAFTSGFLGTPGDLLDLARLQAGETLPGEQQQRELEWEALNRLEQKGYKPTLHDILSLSDDDEYVPRYSRLPSSKDIEQSLGEERPEGFVEEFLQRAGKSIGGGLSLGGGWKSLLGLLGGAGAGAGAKAIGMPDEVADVVDVATSFVAGKPSKELIPGKKNKKIVELLRKKGFTDKEITPVIQGERKLNLLGKLASKDQKLANRLKSTKDRIGLLYDDIKQAGSKVEGLTIQNVNKLESQLGKKLDDIRPMFKRLVNDELHDLATSEHKAKDLIDFYQDINAKVKGVEGGKAVLNKLKGPVLDALKDIDPKIAEDFQLANELYAKLAKTAVKLKPKKWEELLDLGKIYGLGAGLATGNMGMLAKVAGTAGGRVLARELLINPKLQALSRQIANHIKRNNKPGIRNATLKFLDYLKEEDPQVWEQLSSNPSQNI